jgi:adenine-specific DNA-methyltransferase
MSSSIDDHEIHNLRLIMNEIFGEENFICQIVVQLNPRGRHLDRFIARTHEYLIVYARNANEQALIELDKDERMTKEYNKEDEQGRYRELELRNRNPSFNKTTRPNLYYPIFIDPKTENVSLEKDTTYQIEVLPLNSTGGDSCWTWGKTKFRKQQYLLYGRKTNEGKWRVFRKDYLLKGDGTTATTLPKALWTEKELNNDYGKKAIQELFDGETVFDFPKAVDLIKKMLKIGTGIDDIVFDFFAGSCATAQAVLELNREEGGNRRFIMVQLPEPTGKEQFPTIAEIGKERIRRVVARMKDLTPGPSPKGRGEQAHQLGMQLETRDTPEDLGFKVFKLAESNYRHWDGAQPDAEAYARQAELFADPLVEGWKAENVLYEVALKEGYGLNVQVEDSAVKGVQRVTDPDKGQSFYLTLAGKIELKELRPLDLKKDELFICRDAALDDEAAANLALQCRLKTI